MNEQEAQTLALVIIGGLFTMLWWFFRQNLTSMKQDMHDWQEEYRRENNRTTDQLLKSINNIVLLRNEWLKSHGETLVLISTLDAKLADLRDRRASDVIEFREIRAEYARIKEELEVERRQLKMR